MVTYLGYGLLSLITFNIISLHLDLISFCSSKLRGFFRIFFFSFSFVSHFLTRERATQAQLTQHALSGGECLLLFFSSLFRTLQVPVENIRNIPSGCKYMVISKKGTYLQRPIIILESQSIYRDCFFPTLNIK